MKTFVASILMPRVKNDFFTTHIMSYRVIPETYAAITEHIIDVLARIVCDYLIGERCTGLKNYWACVLGVDELITRYDIWSICYGNHVALVDRCATDYNKGLCGACRGGQYRMARWLIARGACCFNRALAAACGGGRVETAVLMVDLGATDFNTALCAACYGGHIETAVLMVDLGADYFDGSLLAACQIGHLELVKLMIKHGARHFGRAVYTAQQGGYTSIVNFIRNHCKEKNISCWHPNAV